VKALPGFHDRQGSVTIVVSALRDRQWGNEVDRDRRTRSLTVTRMGGDGP